jgi:hypothetical protein
MAAMTIAIPPAIAQPRPCDRRSFMRSPFRMRMSASGTGRASHRPDQARSEPFTAEEIDICFLIRYFPRKASRGSGIPVRNSDRSGTTARTRLPSHAR